MPRTTMASLQAQIAALTAQIANTPAAAPVAKSFYTKAEIAAGEGFPCSAKPACKRRLRTAAGASSHDPKSTTGWHGKA